MHELYIVAIIAIGVCTMCFSYMGVELARLTTQIKLIRHDLGIDKRDYKCLLEIEDNFDSKNL